MSEGRVTPSLLALTVEAHHEVEVVVGGEVEQAAPDVKALRLLTLAGLRAVTVQPLSDHPRAVARLLKPSREDVATVFHSVPAVGVEVADDLVVVGVLAGDEGRARRAAERERINRVGEARATVGEQLLDVWHMDEIGGGLIVGHDHDDVRLLAFAGADFAGLGRRYSNRRAGQRGEGKDWKLMHSRIVQPCGQICASYGRFRRAATALLRAPRSRALEGQRSAQRRRRPPPPRRQGFPRRPA